MKKHLHILLLLGIALFSLWCTGGLMRKCDQAATLAGAYELAHGRLQDPAAYYQYDKTYILYWTCAAVLKLLPDGLSPVAVTNISLALLFWSALALFAVNFRRTLDPWVLLCFATSPAVFLNTLYVNSTLLSSAFVLLSALFLFQAGARGGWMAALFFFLAVGARADVILLLPLLLWLITPLWPAGTLPRPFSKQLKLGAAGILALAAGRALCAGESVSTDLFFNSKMVAGYAVFGFGAAGLLFGSYAFRLAGQTLRGPGWWEKLYRAAGLAALLLPVLFFIPQLHAPRYFWRACEALLLLAASGRLPAWNSRAFKVGLALAALLPMVLGVRLPAWNRPQLTVLHPTLFPSGDGVYPMGGYAPFLLRLRQAAEQPLDHNQRIWAAVHSAQFEFSPEGTIEVLRTPMYGYFMLEAALRGGSVQFRSSAERSGSFYADSRSLMRDDPKTPLRDLPQILELPALFVSPVLEGVGILRFGAGDDQWGRQTRLLNALFAGNEYRVLNPGRQPDAARQAFYFSSRPFAGSARHESSGLYYSTEPPAAVADGVRPAEAVLPRWMSIQTFRSGR